MSSIIHNIRSSLTVVADEQTRKSFERFFKEEARFYGVKMGMVNQIAKEHFVHVKTLDKKEILVLCEELLKSGLGEEAAIAALWADKISKKFEPEDFKILEHWVHTYIDTWAKCDSLCNHAVGSFVQKYPEYLKKLLEWTNSKNRWVKRAAAVTLIVPAKRGLFLPEIFKIADKLLLDTDDMVQKGYGWLLKEAAETHQKDVFDYVMKHKHHMPRTALRYAIEKMPQELRALAMAKEPKTRSP